LITVTVTLANRSEVEAMLDRVADIGERLGPLILDEGMNFAHEVVLDIFRGEGTSGIVGGAAWASLKKYTQLERTRLGFPPEHPILFRTGSLLDALVDEGSPDNVFEITHVGPGHWRAMLGTTDTRFEELQVGDASRNLPARPMWPVGDAETRFVGALNERVMKLVEEEF
jgi:hypothetical protein